MEEDLFKDIKNKEEEFNPLYRPEEKERLRASIFLPVSTKIMGLLAATATNYGRFFESERSYMVLAITEEHGTAGTDNTGAVTLQIEKCASGVAPDSGVNLLATAFSLKATIDTPQYGSLTTTKSDLILKRGDKLVLKDSGVLTAVADVCVTLILREI